MQPNFKIGDRAVYPRQGVAEITGIESKEILGSQEVFYILRVLDTDKKIMVPVAKVDSVGLREVIRDADVAKVYELLKKREVPADHTTWNRRYRRYLEKINTGSVFDVAEVVRDLYILRVDKPLSFGERKMLEEARELLIKELSVARRVEESVVTQDLIDIFGPDTPPDHLLEEEED
jgi:CarD family transcriptional regulator